MTPKQDGGGQDTTRDAEASNARTVRSALVERELVTNRVDRTIEGMTPLGEVTHDIMSLHSNEQATNKQYVSVLQKDPVLVARLFRVANSSFYRRGVVDDVVRRLGTRAIFNIVTSLSVGKAIGRRASLAFGYEERGLWRHSFCVAHLAQKLSDLLAHSRPVFLIGLIHEIGKIVVDAVVSEMNCTMQFVTEHDESRSLGVDHAEIGSKIAIEWGLPSSVVEAVRNHHALEAREFLKDAAIVNLADTLLMRLGIGMAAQSEAPIEPRAIEPLGLDVEQTEQLLQRLSPMVTGFDQLGLECME